MHRTLITMSDWNTGVITEFRKNHGKVGGQFEGAPILLINHTGARTGKARTTTRQYKLETDIHTRLLPHDSLVAVLFVADLFHPGRRLAIKLFLNRDMGHGRCRRGTVPVLLIWRDPYHVTRPNRLDGSTPALHQTATRCHDQSLA